MTEPDASVLIMLNQEPQPTNRPDYGFCAIIALVVSVAIWLVAMPLVPAITSATLSRFHLMTGWFPWWAVQQPIPSMYNFANRYEIRELPPALIEPIIDTTEWHFINHFPARAVTFADKRYYLLRDGQDRWVTIESAYRGRRLTTRFHVAPRPSGGFILERLSSQETRP